MGRAIGIDLGTTNSCAAVIKDGRPEIITYKGGNTTIPSMFAVGAGGKELVGHEAKRQAQMNPRNTVTASKRLIGRNFNSKVIDQVRQVFTYELVEGEESEVLVRVQEQVYSLEQISAAILRRIREVAEDYLGEEVDQAVITVPAYFNDRQRQAVRKAGKLASLRVLRILNEPTAAALAYGIGKSLTQRIGVYDLGGGTFDVSIIDIKDRIFEVIATGGDTFLGGVDFDDRLLKLLLEDFHDKHDMDLSFDRVAIQRIRDAAEQAKIELSSVGTTRIHIPFIARDDNGRLDIEYDLSRDHLEDLCGPLVERTISTCERILLEADTAADQVDEMLLVGGQSRMPLVQSSVEALIGKPMSRAVHPDEAVAIGASIIAHSLSGQGASNLTLLDVLPMPIGLGRADGALHVLFKKNQPLPDYKTRKLTTSKDNQRSIMLRLYQGEERLVADNELLGTFVFSGLRPAPKGEVKIEVTFHIDSEGILNLSARDRGTGQTVESKLKLGAKPTESRPQSDSEQTMETSESPPTEGPPEESRPPVPESDTGKKNVLPPQAPTESRPDDATDTSIEETRDTDPGTQLSEGMIARVSGWLKNLFDG